MLFSPPPPPPPEWTPSDIATVVIAGAALIVSVASVVSTFLIHRLQGPVVKVKILYHADLRDKKTYKPNAPDLDAEPKILMTTTLRKAAEVAKRFPDDKYYPTTFLRVHITNAGRMDTGIDSISYVNKAGAGIGTRKIDGPEGPIPLPAQSYTTEDYLYSEARTQAGAKGKIRFVVYLTNGKKVKTRFVKLEAKYSKPF